MTAHLPAESLPLRFSVYASTSRSSAVAPCCSVNLEGIQIFRTLEPGLQESFVSVGRMFATVGMSTIQGLLRFDLRSPSHQTSLAFAPCADIWVPLPRARQIASDLNIGDVLAGLLDERSSLAWSILDLEGGSPTLVHK